MSFAQMETIKDKIYHNERLSFDDGLYLLNSTDLFTIGQLANVVRARKNKDHVYFIQNTHVNYTNVCSFNCQFCAFGVKANNPSAYTLSLSEFEKKIIAIKGKGFTEIHIVGGVNPKLPLSYYEEMLRLVNKNLSSIHIQAFTAVEIDYIARLSKITVKETLLRLKKAGLGSILGGGAEIFAPEIRKVIAEHKTDASRWLSIHRQAHELNINSNASMLYGHIETQEQVIDHLIRLRDLQDETAGFNAFFGFSFQPGDTPLAKQFKLHHETSGWYDLKLLAVARLMLDNFPHIRALWMLIGQKLAQVSLNFGVDDLDGTVMEEQIVHAAGNKSKQMVPKQSFINMIKETGKIPVERDTLYNVIRTY